MPQVIVWPGVLLATMCVCFILGPGLFGVWLTVAVEIVLGIVLVWMLSFFRDPARVVPADKDVLVAPADGRITDIETVREDNFLGQEALRIGIFLSIFDVHINRSPCAARIEQIKYKKGMFKNATRPVSSQVNESNDVAMVRLDEPRDRLLVRQISGAIARRIVCSARKGQDLAGGEKFGMIKFGSRTELYLPIRDNARCMVKIGDKVKAGSTILVRYSR